MRISFWRIEKKGYEAFGVASLSEALKDFLSLREALLYRLNLLSIYNLVRKKKDGVFGGVVRVDCLKRQIRITHLCYTARGIS